jgi:hypothetical protein
MYANILWSQLVNTAAVASAYNLGWRCLILVPIAAVACAVNI